MKRKKLELQRKTITVLTPARLGDVVGGGKQSAVCSRNTDCYGCVTADCQIG
jgi:hypothetical protein